MDIIRYVDPVNGNDANNGETPQTAKKTLQSVVSIINRSSDNKIIRIRGGHCHEPTPGTAWWNSFSGFNVTIEAYWLEGDEPTNPLLDGVTWLSKDSGGWFNEGAATNGGYVWSIALGTGSTVRRVWSNASNNGVRRSQRTLGDALRRTPDYKFDPLGITPTGSNLPSIKDKLSVTDNWFCADAALGWKLYMWTPYDNVDPSKHYNGLGVAQSGAGTNGIGSGFTLYNSRNFAIKNIDVRAATAFAFAISVTDTDAVVEDISFYRCGSFGTLQSFRVAQTSTAAYLTCISRVELRECFADPLTSAKEQEPNQGYSIMSGADQYDIRGKVRDVQIVDCIGRNPTHAAMSLGGWDGAGAITTRSGYLRHTVICDDWCTYSRSLNMNFADSSCYVKNCTIIGTNVVAQLAGSAEVTGNKFFGLRKAIRKPSTPAQATDGWVAANCYRGTLTNGAVGNDGYYDTKPSGLLFANNMCDGCYGTPVEVLVYSSTEGAAAKPQASLVDNSFMFWNNVLIDTVPERAGKPYLATDQTGGLSVGTQSFRNNLIYCGEGVTPTARWQGVTYADINSAPGHSGNLTVNPLVDAQLKPLPGSPLARAGVYCGVTRDHDGKRFGLKPAIGAHEIVGTPTRQTRPV